MVDRLGVLLFPPMPRDFCFKRHSKTLLRSLHLIGMAGVGGAYFYPAQPADWLPFLWLTLVSGLLMVAIEIWSHGIWLLQLRGVAIMVKLILLLGVSLPGAVVGSMIPVATIIVVIVISGIISHATRNLRYYSPFYRRRISVDDWQWREPPGKR